MFSYLIELDTYKMLESGAQSHITLSSLPWLVDIPSSLPSDCTLHLLFSYLKEFLLVISWTKVSNLPILFYNEYRSCIYTYIHTILVQKRYLSWEICPSYSHNKTATGFVTICNKRFMKSFNMADRNKIYLKWWDVLLLGQACNRHGISRQKSDKNLNFWKWEVGIVMIFILK